MIKSEKKLELEERLKQKLTNFAVKLIDCGMRRKVDDISELGIYILRLTADDTITEDTINAVFELVGICKGFERRSEDRKRIEISYWK